MERLADWAAERDIRVSYSSDLQRTKRGAEIVSLRCNIPVCVTPALREKHFGQWEGLTYEEAETRFPSEWTAWIADPPASRPPGGETYRELESRVMNVLSKILRDHKNESVLLLAHGGVNRVFLCHALQLPLDYVFRIEQDYATLNHIEYTQDGHATVRLLNGALPGDPLLTTVSSERSSG